MSFVCKRENEKKKQKTKNKKRGGSVVLFTTMNMKREKRGKK